jgi:uncharacterized protein (DUF1684 family)
MLYSCLYLASLLVLFLQVSATTYNAEIERWQHAREAGLKADGGWLTVAGLFWLRDGQNSVGTDKSNAIVLPADSAPGSVGVFTFHDGQTQFEAAPRVRATVDGQPAISATLKADSAGEPDILRVDDLTMFVIQRGKRFGIRLKDNKSGMRRAFTGLKFFPPDETYRVKAKFVPYNPPKMIPVPNILGETEEDASPGYVEFTLNGHPCRLDPVTEDNSLFFIFKDLTSGRETYPPGRFLNTEMPKDGVVTLDFNKAYNPPCAFTPFATCPLPPKQNQLAVRIEAGELRYGH